MDDLYVWVRSGKLTSFQTMAAPHMIRSSIPIEENRQLVLSGMLGEACLANNYDMVSLLCTFATDSPEFFTDESGAVTCSPFGQVMQHGRRVLHYMAKATQSKEIWKMLLTLNSLKEQIDCHDDYGQTPGMVAVAHDRLAVLEVLHREYGCLDDRLQMEIYIDLAAKFGSLECLNYLFQKGSMTNISFGTTCSAVRDVAIYMHRNRMIENFHDFYLIMHVRCPASLQILNDDSVNFVVRLYISISRISDTLQDKFNKQIEARNQKLIQSESQCVPRRTHDDCSVYYVPMEENQKYVMCSANEAHIFPFDFMKNYPEYKTKTLEEMMCFCCRTNPIHPVVYVNRDI